MRHQYGISVLVSQTLFGGEASGSVTKCGLFSQAICSLFLCFLSKWRRVMLVVARGNPCPLILSESDSVLSFKAY